MPTEAEMKAAIDRAEGARIANVWMRKNIRRFEPCDANSQLIGEWLQKNNLPLTEENLDRAADAIGHQLARAVGEPVAATPTLADVAPVPSYFPRMETLADIRRISPDRMRQLRQGPHLQALINRINALKEGFRNPVAATPVSQAVSVDDGLPPIPPGLRGWPSTVSDIEEMPRPEFRLLYHSKKHGEAFRKRIEAIYASERGR